MTETLPSEEIITPIDEETTEDEPLFHADEVLGKYISHHPVNRLRLMAQAFVVYLIVTTILQVFFVELDDQTASIFLIFAFAAIALAISWYVMHLWNREVVVYESGYTYREGSVIADFNYDEVASFQQKAERLRYFGGVFRRNVYSFTVRTYRDEVITVNNLYTDIEKLGNNLEVGINSVLRDKIRASLQRGESVTFGDDFEVNEDGIMTDDQSITWDAFAGFSSKSGHLVLSTVSDEAWFTYPLDEVNNLTLLIEILRQKVPKSDDVS